MRVVMGGTIVFDRDSAPEKAAVTPGLNVAAVILNHNTPELCRRLRVQIDRMRTFHPSVQTFIFDNGCKREGCMLKHDFSSDVNLGFTHGMMEAVSSIRDRDGDFDLFWLLNSDIRFPDPHTLEHIANLMDGDSGIAQISPAYNSPHHHMSRPGGWFSPRHGQRTVPFLETTMTLVRTETMDKIGWWDLDFTLGFGVDIDLGWRVREAGYFNVVDYDVHALHLEHQSMEDPAAYRDKAKEEMQRVMVRKYGEEWRRIRK